MDRIYIDFSIPNHYHMRYFTLLKFFRYYSVMHLPGRIDIDKMDYRGVDSSRPIILILIVDTRFGDDY